MKKCLMVIPAFEPRRNFEAYIDELLQLHIGSIVVVDDGSGMKYRNLFRSINKKEHCNVIYHDQNYGKGAAIKTGTKWCMDHYFDFEGIITVDCDGQHLPSDVMAVYNSLCHGSTHGLVIGTRDYDTKDTPAITKFVNSFTSRIMGLIYGIHLDDTQSGLRGYPREMLDWLLEVEGDRYEFELNTLIEAKKHDMSFVTVDMHTVFIRGNADSHFRPFKDTVIFAKILIKGLLKYFASSLIATAVDISLFTVLTKVFFSYMPNSTKLLIGTLIARIFSSILNYTINSKVVFRQNTSFYPTMFRFYTLWFCQMCVSYGLVLLFTTITPVDSVIIKLCVDAVLALISYQFQLRWVFKTPENNKKKRLS